MHQRTRHRCHWTSRPSHGVLSVSSRPLSYCPVLPNDCTWAPVFYVPVYSSLATSFLVVQKLLFLPPSLSRHTPALFLIGRIRPFVGFPAIRLFNLCPNTTANAATLDVLLVRSSLLGSKRASRWSLSFVVGQRAILRIGRRAREMVEGELWCPDGGMKVRKLESSAVINGLENLNPVHVIRKAFQPGSFPS